MNTQDILETLAKNNKHTNTLVTKDFLSQRKNKAVWKLISLIHLEYDVYFRESKSSRSMYFLITQRYEGQANELLFRVSDHPPKDITINWCKPSEISNHKDRLYKAIELHALMET